MTPQRPALGMTDCFLARVISLVRQMSTDPLFDRAQLSPPFMPQLSDALPHMHRLLLAAPAPCWEIFTGVVTNPFPLPTPDGVVQTPRGHERELTREFGGGRPHDVDTSVI